MVGDGQGHADEADEGYHDSFRPHSKTSVLDTLYPSVSDLSSDSVSNKSVGPSDQ